MIELIHREKIEFQSIRPSDRAIFEQFAGQEQGRGCECTFANLYMWGEQSLAVYAEHLTLLSVFGRRIVYPFPFGEGEKRGVIEALMADARERGIPFCLSSITQASKQEIERLYPDYFVFTADEGSFDYVYDINDLADLPGKRYHAKRTHINRFKEAHPHYTVSPLLGQELFAVREMADAWYAARADAEDSFHGEKRALKRALDAYEELALEGLVLKDGNEVLAFTLGSRMSFDTFDVHFEKARADVQGAYPVINQAFASYIRQKHPEITYLDREEDMGIEGLRRAKRSYYPHHMIEKFYARLKEKA